MATLETQLKPARLVPHVFTALRFLLTLALSAFVAYGAAQYRAGAAEQRAAQLAERVQTLEAQTVPRAETQARFDALDKSLAEIKQDVREGRETQKQILFRLSK
jgi:uncharacterized membrane-anchored protein